MSCWKVVACLLIMNVGVLGTGQSHNRDPNLHKILNRLHKARSYWSQDYQNPKESLGSGETSPSYVAYAATSKTSSLVRSSSHQTLENSSLQPTYAHSSQEYWNPGTSHWNNTTTKSYPYSRPFTFFGNGGYGRPLEGKEGTHPAFQYQQSRPILSGQVAVKKVPVYYPKIHIKGLEVSGKPKYKKSTSVLYYPSSTYKKTVYPRVHKPYVIHKYPVKKTASPGYRRYYQSGYQGYVPLEQLRSEESRVSTEGYRTTERRDEIYPSASEDYGTYNRTTEYEENTSATGGDTDANTTTRGYYGERIYMSTQIPLFERNKTSTRNRYLILRRTVPKDDDIETIFE